VAREGEGKDRVGSEGIVQVDGIWMMYLHYPLAWNSTIRLIEW